MNERNVVQRDLEKHIEDALGDSQAIDARCSCQTDQLGCSASAGEISPAFVALHRVFEVT